MASVDVAIVKRRVTSAEGLRRPSQLTRAGFIIWVPFWLSVGIGLWFSLKWQPGLWLYAATGAAAVATLGLCAALRLGFIGVRDEIADRLVLALFATSLIAAGFLLSGWRSHDVSAPVLGFRYYGAIEGRVVGIDRSSRDKVRILLDQVVLAKMAPRKTPARVRLSLPEGVIPPLPGAHVMLTGHLGPPPGPSDPYGFDFRRNAWFERLGAVGYTRTPIMLVSPPDDSWSMTLHRTRMQLSHEIQDRIGGQAGAVASALMTGDRSGISEATNEVMRVSNLYHIISISGLHMAMLAAFAYGALRWIGIGVMVASKRSSFLPIHKIAALGALLASAGYLWLSGGGVATERAFIMVAVMLVAILLDRRAISLRTIAIAALIVLVLGPETLTSPSFQMSFAATIGLVLMQEPWRRVAPHLPKWSHGVALLLLTSAVAGLVTGPLAASHFGRIAPYGLLANLLVVTVMGTLVMPMGVIGLVLAPFGLEGVALWIMGVGTRWMLWVAEWIASLGGADLLVPLPHPIVVPLLGIGMMLMAFARHGTSRLLGPIGLILLIGAAGLWLVVGRPAVLISAEGDAVGIMTATGRAVSKPKGGAFAVSNWLADDGDGASQEMAATRGVWQGDSKLRIADWTVGNSTWRIVHASGRQQPDALSEICRAGTILVVNGAAEKSQEMPDGPCVLLSSAVLRREGAIALDHGAQGLRATTTASVNGIRPWSNARSLPLQGLTETLKKQ